MVTENLKKFNTQYSHSAIVGQEEMKLALQLNVIDLKLGVMIMGDRGTGKSTTIRAIADLLPEIEIVKDDPFNSHKSDLDLMGNEVKLAIQKVKYRNSLSKSQW
jgi:magnesium chelatase subunit I